ncbi:protein of unknown function DUF1555 [Pseudodesulfovibrio mercurii]|uniref:Ice-binding protein C-terminal domain-containing protein n=1 Tax=Pseudodesulfovibrio mercurii TaxID=641491 RepID=F0JCC7_9BACT|nr:PEP-CTERM sorting domain-containing protein [Pseudodesulfovibrio mercurii]EGB14425.1 protein of unknown function DUF1555 [Pseudodesulfovibrio mercurii]
MKRLSAIIMTMALTLLLSSVAYANFLGMDSSDSTYKWTISDMYQQIVDADGNNVDIDTSSLNSVLTSIADLLASGTELYLWGYINVTTVTDTGDVPPTNAWSENDIPDTVTGVFWGIQIVGVDTPDDPTAASILYFSGGQGAFYAGTSDGDSLPSLDVSDYTTDGILDVAALLAAESSWSDTGRFAELFATFDWTDGVLPSNTLITQVAQLTDRDETTGDVDNGTIAQGKFNLDVTSDNNFSELIDSNAYAGESDVEGQVAIQLYGQGGWDFSGESAHLNMTTVPEPSTFLLIGLGMVGCFAYARRRRNNA